MSTLGFIVTSEYKTQCSHFVAIWQIFFVTPNLHRKLLENCLLVVFHVIFNNDDFTNFDDFDDFDNFDGFDDIGPKIF